MSAHTKFNAEKQIEWQEGKKVSGTLHPIQSYPVPKLSEVGCLNFEADHVQ